MISGREFARRVGRSEMYIRKLVSSGVLYREGGKMDYESNLERMIKNGYLDPTEIKNTHTTANKNVPRGTPEPIAGESESKNLTITEARRLKTIADADKARLEADKLAGILVEADKVRNDLADVGIKIRQVFEQMPEQTIDLILACPNRKDAFNLMLTEIHDRLNLVADIIEGRAVWNNK